MGICSECGRQDWYVVRSACVDCRETADLAWIEWLVSLAEFHGDQRSVEAIRMGVSDRPSKSLLAFAYRVAGFENVSWMSLHQIPIKKDWL